MGKTSLVALTRVLALGCIAIASGGAQADIPPESGPLCNPVFTWEAYHQTGSPNPLLDVSSGPNGLCGGQLTLAADKFGANCNQRADYANLRGIRRSPAPRAGANYVWYVAGTPAGPQVRLSDDSVKVCFDRSAAEWAKASVCIPRDRATLSGDPSSYAAHLLWLTYQQLLAVLPTCEAASPPVQPAGYSWSHPETETWYDCYFGEIDIILVKDVKQVATDGTETPYYWGTANHATQCIPQCDPMTLDLRFVLTHEIGHAMGFGHLPDSWASYLMAPRPQYYSWNIELCQRNHARRLYPNDVAQCDLSPDAFVDDYTVRPRPTGGAIVDWSSTYERDTDHFVLFSSEAQGGPWTVCAEVAPDSSHAYSVSTLAGGPFFRLMELTTTGDTLHCATDSLMIERPTDIGPSQAVVDSIALSLKSQFSLYWPIPWEPMPGPETEWVCLGPEEWRSAVQPLVDFWQSRGHQARFRATVNTAFHTYIANTPYTSIKTYLANLYDGGQGAVRYVLLLGDASNASFSSSNVIFTNYHYNPTLGWWTPDYASDWDYVDFNGDHAPELAIGRAPVQSASEVTLFVDKTIRATLASNSALPHDNLGLWEFARDHGPRPGAFVHANGVILKGMIPPWIQVRELIDNAESPMTDQTRRELAIDAMEEGRGIIAVMGTGTGYNNWHMLNAQTFSWSMTQSSWSLHPLILGLTCDIGDIDLGEGLLERGMLAAGRGPWGGFGPSRATLFGGAREIGESFLREVYGPSTLAVGEASRRTVAAFAGDSSYAEAAWSYMVLGDPLTPVSNGVAATPLWVNISGPGEVGCPGSETFAATAGGGNGIYAFNWFRRAVGTELWYPAGSGSSTVIQCSTPNQELRCVVLSGGLSAEAVRCAGSTSQPSYPSLSVEGPRLVEPGSVATWTAFAGDRSCVPFTYRWQWRPAGATTFSQVVSTAAIYGRLMDATGFDLLVIAARVDQQFATIVEVRPSQGGAGCPIVDVFRHGEWKTENSILGRSLTGEVNLDASRLRWVDVGESLVTFRIRENELEHTILDELRVVAIDHSPDVKAYALGDIVKLGWPRGPAKVMAGSLEITDLLTPGGAGYTMEQGETLLVWLRPPASASARSAAPTRATSGDNVIIDDGGGKGGGTPAFAARPVSPAEFDAQVLASTGLVIESAAGADQWTLVGHIYPREYPSDWLLETAFGSALRVTALDRRRLRALGSLIQSGEQLRAQKLSLVSAVHSRLGDVVAQVSTLGNLQTEIDPGDTVVVTMRNPPVADSDVREYFLLTRGVYSGSLPARGQGNGIPHAFRLALGGPNPFGGTTSLHLDIPHLAHVRLELFDMQGRRVRTLTNKSFDAGVHFVDWDTRTDDGGRVQAGVYFCRMSSPGFEALRKLVVLP